MYSGRGFIQLTIMGYVVLGLGAVILALSIALKVQTSRLSSLQKEHSEFVEKVRLAGEIAEKSKVVQEARDRKLKERTDADYKTRIARLERDNKRLRDSAHLSVVPSAPPSSASPERACFSRADLDTALQRFIAGAAELAIEGDSGIAGLDAAKRWAAER